MKCTTTLIDYKGQAAFKIPRKVTKALGLKPEDKYTVTLTPEKHIYIQFFRS